MEIRQDELPTSSVSDHRIAETGINTTHSLETISAGEIVMKNDSHCLHYEYIVWVVIELLILNLSEVIISCW